MPRPATPRSSATLAAAPTALPQRESTAGRTRALRGLAIAARFPAGLAGASIALGALANAQVDRVPLEALEGFVLAADRAAFVAALLPGSPGQRQLAALASLQLGRFEEVEALLMTWAGAGLDEQDRSNYDALTARLALQRFEREPERTWQYLQGLFPKVRSESDSGPGGTRTGPTQLDPERISEARFQALRDRGEKIPFEGWSQAARWAYDASQLSIADQRRWLSAGVRPDAPALPAVLEALLAEELAVDFKALLGATRLMSAQFEALAASHPELLARDAFLVGWIAALSPVPGRDEPRETVQARLDALAQRLPPSKAGFVLRIELNGLQGDLQAGRLDEPRLLRALALAADDSLAKPELLEQLRREGYVFGSAAGTHLPAADEAAALVRPLLLRALAGRPDLGLYEVLLDGEAARSLWVEAQLLAGDPRLDFLRERLANDVRFAKLEARRELEFDPALPEFYPAEDALVLQVHAKGLRELSARLFAIDPAAVTRRGLPSAIDLDLTGFEPIEIQRYSLRANPFERQIQRLEFVRGQGPGLYLVELHGDGLRSRLLIHKGGLFAECRPSAAGTSVRLVDELGRPRPGARLWLEQREFVADSEGELFLPYAPEPATEKAVLLDGGRVGLASVRLYAEHYDLALAAHVETAFLRTGARAELLARPLLTLDGSPLPLALLSDLALELSAELPGEQRCLRRYGGLERPERGEWRLPFEVPAQASNWRLRLTARIRPTGGDEAIDLASDSIAFDAARARSSEHPAMLLLARDREGYALELRGRGGEPRPGQELRVWLMRAGYPGRIQCSLFTDAGGRAGLGALEGIAALEVAHGGLEPLQFSLEQSALAWPAVVHAEAGQPIELMLPPDLPAAARISLLEKHATGFAADRSAALRRRAGQLRIDPLPPGDYSLWCLERDTELLLRIAPAEAAPGRRSLEPRLPSRLAIAALEADPAQLAVALEGVDASTRVYLLAGRYASEQAWSEALAPRPTAPPAVYHHAPETPRRDTGGRLSDEERYVFERRFRPKFPGSLLERPGLLLAPWDLDQAELHNVVGIGGGAGSGSGRLGGRAATSHGHGGRASGASNGASYADFDVFPDGPRLLGPLAPDADGRVRVERRALGDGPWVRVLAISDGGIASATWLGPPSPWEPQAPATESGAQLPAAAGQEAARDASPPTTLRELRLLHALAPGEALLLAPAEPQTSATVADLGAAFDLLAGGPQAKEFARFRFLTRWPGLSAAERLELYDEHVCHELNFFLRRRDPAFFAEVVAPALRNKGQRDCFDRWLLGEPLEDWLAPARFRRLSAFERLLSLEASGASATRRSAFARDLEAEHPASAAGQRRAFDAVLAAAALGGDPGPSPGSASAGEAGSADSGSADGSGAPARGGEAGSRPAAPAGPSSGGPTSGSPGPPSLTGAGPTTGASDPDRDAAKELAARERSNPLPRGPGHTRRWVESFWWRRAREQGPPDFVGTEFWLAFAGRTGGRPFLNLPQLPAAAGVSERLLALAVLDLPFEAVPPKVGSEGRSRRLEASTPLLVLERRFEPCPLELTPQLSVDVDLIRIEAAGRGQEVRVRPDQLEAGQPYRLRVTVGHAGEAPLAGDLLLTLPPGALALDGGPPRRTLSLRLAALDRAQFEVGCYFPAPGRFEAHSAQVHAGERCRAFAPSLSGAVRPFGAPGSEPSLEQRVERASAAELVEILSACGPDDLERLARPNGDALTVRLEDPGLCRAVLEVLRERLWFDAEWWSYGLWHRDLQATRELLADDQRLRACLEDGLDTPLLRLDPFLDHGHEALDFAPLWPARAHPFGGEAPADDELAQAYRRLLEQLACTPSPDDGQRLALCIHWLYQGRQAEALELFAGIRREGLVEQVQHDYAAASLALLQSDTNAARRAAERGLELPLPRWRRRFGDLLAFVDAVEGRAPLAASDAPRAGPRPEPERSLALEERAGQPWARWSGLDSVELCLYPIDLELAFSRQPFSTGGDLTSGAVLPERRLALPIAGPRGEQALALPAEYAARPALLELRSGALAVRRLWQPAGLLVDLSETQGRLTAQKPDGRPAPAAYVKVYVREPDGQVRFHKDGYTDLLGRFDYSARTPPGPRAERFALLVLDPDGGARLLEAGPGPR